MSERQRTIPMDAAVRAPQGGAHSRSGQRKLFFRTLSLLFLLAAAVILFPVASPAQEEIRVGGTGGALAVMRELASAYRQHHRALKITVLPSLGSSGGIRAVLAGALDLGVSSRPLKEKEKSAIMNTIGRTPFVFVMRKPAPISGLTIETLEALYTGRTRSWPDGRPARVVLRPEAEYDTMLLRSMSPEMDRAITEGLEREGMIIAITDQNNAHALRTIPGAVGSTTMGQVLCERLPFSVLSLNGVAPGPDTLASGEYPFSKTYYLVLMPDARPAVRQFADFILSPEGRAVLSRCGYQPVH